MSEIHVDPPVPGTGSQAAGIIQATALVTAIILVVKGLGFAEKLLLAFFFGTGPEVDAYLVAYSIPFSAYVILREVVKPSFLPTFLQSRREGEGRDWRLFAVTGTLLVLLLGMVTTAGVLFARPLMALAAPGFAGEQRELAVQLLRLVMPALLLMGASSLTTAALYARKRFALPAIGEASFRAGPIVLLLATGGVAGTAVGVVLGALGKVIIEVWGLRQHLVRLRPSLDISSVPVRTVGRLAAPLLGSLFLSLFVAPLVENAFASKVGVGGVAALAYSRKIVETLTSILPYTLGLVLLPFSAEMAARQDSQGLARTLSSAVRSLILLFLPVAVGLMLLREPFVRLLLERGAFTASSTQMTAEPLFYYALALLPFGLEVIVIQFFFARQDTLTPVLADVASFALNVALIPLLLPAFGLGGIALAAALAKAAKVLALLVLFGRRVPAFRLADLAPFAAKMLLAALATAAILGLWVLTAGSLGGDHGILVLAAYLSTGGLLGGGAFLLTAHLLGVQEPAIAWQRTWAWWRTRRGRSGSKRNR